MIKYKTFDYSKLFNNGVNFENDILIIRWKSQLITDDESLGASGVKYIITIANKSIYSFVDFIDLTIETIEFELTKDILEQKEKKYHNIIIIQSRSIPPEKSKTFEMDILMKFASLDTYDDKMIVKGKWKR
jgi:hypothetical protein